MKAEIIAVGSELLTPDNVDTNSLYLTHRLNEAGCQVQLKTVVGDDQDDIAAVLREALQRSDLVIFSGGLGPTEDDLTRSAVASVLGRSVAIDEGILETLRQRFIARGFQMAKVNERQAEVIEERRRSTILSEPLPGCGSRRMGALYCPAARTAQRASVRL